MAHVVAVVGLGFGDEGKGSVVDYLVREHQAKLVVRFNGGAQAAHSVVTDDGRHHVFSQFGSGSFVPGVRTHLSRFMMVNPGAMLNEAEALAAAGVGDALSRVTVDPRALVTTELHTRANRLRESQRGSSRHGSCGMGIGETMAYALACPEGAIRVADLFSGPELRDKLAMLAGYMRREFGATWGQMPDFQATVLRSARFAGQIELRADDDLPSVIGDGVAVFEGAQGVLLDETHGFSPFTTWSTTTLQNVDELLRGFSGTVRRVGVLRSYMTRHGAGPFPTEDPETNHPEAHNGTHPWQGRFRQGPLDIQALRYAIKCSPVDVLAVTHMDRMTYPGRVCLDYDRPFKPDAAWLAGAKPTYRTISSEAGLFAAIEGNLNRRVAITSHGPTAADKRTR